MHRLKNHTLTMTLTAPGEDGKTQTQQVKVSDLTTFRSKNGMAIGQMLEQMFNELVNGALGLSGADAPLGPPKKPGQGGNNQPGMIPS